MAVKRMDHVGIVVEDIEAAKAFFTELGLKLLGDGSVQGQWVDRVVGLEGIDVDIAMMETPDGHSRLELSQFRNPPAPTREIDAPPNAAGIRHITFAVDDVDEVLTRLQARGAELVGSVERYEDSYRLCYIRGPEGIIVELTEELGGRS